MRAKLQALDGTQTELNTKIAKATNERNQYQQSAMGALSDSHLKSRAEIL
jgi:hypothetical protein